MKNKTLREKRKVGFCAIGVFNSKNKYNIGTIWRSAQLLDVDYIFTIGDRYKWQPTDTLKSTRHVPLLHYKDWKDFIEHKPDNAQIVLIEQSDRHNLGDFRHPKQAIYVLGAEDIGIPEEYFKGNTVLNIPSNSISSFNVAVAGSLVIFDRYLQSLNQNTK